MFSSILSEWLSLLVQEGGGGGGGGVTSVDGICDAYVGLLETLNILEIEGGTGWSISKGLAKK